MAFRSAFGKGILPGGLLLTAVALAGCGGNNWPDLSKVQRPVGSDQPADMGDADLGDTDLGGAVGDDAELSSGRSAPAATAEVAERIRALGDNLNATDRAVEISYAAYLGDLDRLLKSSPDPETLTRRWTTSQSSLSRVGVAVDKLRVERDALANYGLELGKGRRAPAGVAETVKSAAELHDRRRGLLELETNRLSVLTPRALGSPGPAAVYDSTRTALATISFAGAKPNMEADLAPTIRALQKTVPDVAFDVIATGPTGTEARQQDALRSVMAEFRRLNVPASHVTLALASSDTAAADVIDKAVTVRLYVKKSAS